MRFYPKLYITGGVLVYCIALLGGMLYRNTKNLWLVMIIHAMIDLVPNFTGFQATWHP